MNNDKNLKIKKKPQEVTDEELNKVAGGNAKLIDECDDLTSHPKGHNC